MAFLDVVATRRFIDRHHRSLVLDSDHPGRLLDLLERYERPQIDKARWIFHVNGMRSAP